jgi:hypothetical protein
MIRFFRVTPPSVYQMVLGLEKAGLISRKPGDQNHWDGVLDAGRSRGGARPSPRRRGVGLPRGRRIGEFDAVKAEIGGHPTERLRGFGRPVDRPRRQPDPHVLRRHDHPRSAVMTRRKVARLTSLLTRNRLPSGKVLPIVAGAFCPGPPHLAPPPAAAFPAVTQLRSGDGPADKRCRATVEGRLVRHPQRQAEQTNDRADQPLSLPIAKTEHGAQGQRRQNRQRRIGPLPTSFGAWRRRHAATASSENHTVTPR